MKKFMSVAVILLAVASASSFGQQGTTEQKTDCGPKEHHRDQHREMGFKDGEAPEKVQGKMIAALQLSDSQKKSLSEARAKSEPEHKLLHEKIMNAHEALRAADDAQADEATLKKLASNIADLMTQQELMRIKERRAFLAQLTPEQKKSMDQWQKDHPRPEHFAHPNP